MPEKIKLRYGGDALEIALPDGCDWRTVSPKGAEPLEDIRAALLASMDTPVGSPPLGEIVQDARSVAVVVCDSTRPIPTRDFLPHLLDYLNECGVGDSAIDVIIAYGTHRRMSDEETRALLGERACGRVRINHHDCRDETHLVDLGTTSQGLPVRVNKLVAQADIVITTGGVAHHYFAGFGGGRKTIVPGCAAHDTILANHRLVLQERGMLLHPHCRSGVLGGNPVHEAALEAARMAGDVFSVNIVLNPDGQIAHFFSGALDGSHRRACEEANEIFTARLDGQATLVLASCGGAPADTDLIQMHKGIDHAASAVRDGGRLIICGAAENGVGSATFERWFDYPDLPSMAAAVRADYTLNAHTAYAMREKAERIRISLFSGLDPELVRRMGITPIDSVQNALDEAAQEASGAAYVIPTAALTVTRCEPR